MTVEAEMSHVRTSAHRPRKAGDVFLARACWSENPRVADLSCSLGQEKPLSQLKQGDNYLPRLCPFLPFRPSAAWMMPGGPGEGNCLHLGFTDPNANLIWKCPTGKPQDNVYPNICVPRDPARLTCKSNHHTQL